MLDSLKFLFTYTYNGTRGGYLRLKKQVLLSVCIFASVRNTDLTIVLSPRNHGNSQPGSRNGSAILGPMPVRSLVCDLRVASGGSKFRRLAILGTGHLGAWLALSLSLGASPADLPVFRPNDPVTRSGFERFYNMDYARAIEDMEKVAARHPDDPYAVNNLANTYLIRELFRMGALDPADYANDSFVGTPQRPAATEAKN